MLRRTGHITLGLLPVLLLPALLLSASMATKPSLSAEQRRALLGEAQQTYDGGVAAQRTDPEEANRLFGMAAERFRLLIDDGVDNGRLRYNLANAELQAGRLGEAILDYRRAERLIPGDPRLRSNLEYARSLVESRLEPRGGRALLDALLSWHDRTPTKLRLGVFVVAYGTLWLGLLLSMWRLRPPALWRTAFLAGAVVSVASGLSVAEDLWRGDERTPGVLMTDEVVVRKGNGEGYEPRFEQPLHEGVEFELIERRGAWLHIELRDGSTGWIRSSQAGLVGE